MKLFLTGVIIFCLYLLLPGCASQYLGSTEVHFRNGEWSYVSNKNQQDLSAEVGTDKEGRPFGKIKTTSTTPESAIAAALESNRIALEIIQSAIKSGAVAKPVP